MLFFFKFSITYFPSFRITFCGITMKNYVERNISSKSQTTLKYAMKMLSGSSETIIFMFLGVATIHDNHDWNWAFVILTITFCTVFRIIGEFINRYIYIYIYLHISFGEKKSTFFNNFCTLVVQKCEENLS